MSPRYLPDLNDGAADLTNVVQAAEATKGDPYYLQHRGLYTFAPGERWQDSNGELFQEAGERRELGPPPPGLVIPSFWRDLIAIADSEARVKKAFESPVYRGRDPGSVEPEPFDWPSPEEAEERLEIVRKVFLREQRDIVGAGTSFAAPAGAVPGYVAEAFATAARSTSPLADYLIHRPHPGSLTVTTPRIVSGAAVNVQTAENAAVQETDPTSALAQTPTATITGQLDLARQLYDFSNPGADEWVSAELGADYAAKLEVQMISGSGSTGQTTGLRNVSGATAVTHTNATPTAATNYAKIGDLIQQTAVASGIRPDTLVLAPRRKEFIESKLGWVPGWFGLTVIESPSMPLTLGAGTNQDPVIVFPRAEVFLYERGPVFNAYPEVGSSTLTVRVSAIGFAALLASRKPTAVGISTGTEWTAPTF